MLMQIAKQRNMLAIHQRFYASLALHDLVHEVSLQAVAAKYGATKGLLQALQQSAATFAGEVFFFSLFVLLLFTGIVCC